MNHPPVDAVEQRVRRALRAVAETVTDVETTATTAPEGAKAPRIRRRRVALAAGAAAVPLALAAAAILRQGPEYVDTIPPEDVVMSGSVGGSRYLLVESDRTDECGRPVTGVELVEESENLLGSEWNTSGYQYGELVETECGHVADPSRFLSDPALFEASGVEVGDSFVWVFAVHPDVTAVRITAGGDAEDLTVYEVDGAGYAPYEIPRGLEAYTSELVIGGQVVPGSERSWTVPQR